MVTNRWSSRYTSVGECTVPCRSDLECATRSSARMVMGFATAAATRRPTFFTEKVNEMMKVEFDLCRSVESGATEAWPPRCGCEAQSPVPSSAPLWRALPFRAARQQVTPVRGCGDRQRHNQQPFHASRLPHTSGWPSGSPPSPRPATLRISGLGWASVAVAGQAGRAGLHCSPL